MPGSNAVFQAAQAQAAMRASRVGSQTPPAEAATKTHGKSPASAVPYVTLGLMAALVVGYVVWLLMGGEKVSEGIQKLKPNLYNIIFTATSAILGIVLLKLAVLNAEKDSMGSKLAWVRWVGKWIIGPPARLLGFV